MEHLKLSFLISTIIILFTPAEVEGYWCVARSEAGEEALQAAIDYACGSGADCAPLESTGLCFLPNTFQAHASYAFNSFYQRNNMAPGSCDFAGTATLAKTDPSYGSCVYPPNPSTAGGGITTPPTSTTASTTNPYGTVSPTTTTTTTNIPTADGGAGFPSTFGPPISTTTSNAPHSSHSLLAIFASFVALLLVA